MGLRSRPRWIKEQEERERAAPIREAIAKLYKPPPLRIIVVGDRYDDRARFDGALDALHRKRPVALMVVDGRPGATMLARAWARRRGVFLVTESRGLSELLSWHPHGVVAFPEAAETIDAARAAKLTVWQPAAASRRR